MMASKLDSPSKNDYLVWANRTLSRHRDTGYSIEVSPEYLAELARKTERCPLCGEFLQYLPTGAKRGRKRWVAASLDRTDNESKMKDRNVWILCLRCNLMKANRTLEGFLGYCKLVGDKYAEILAKKKEIDQQELGQLIDAVFEPTTSEPKAVYLEYAHQVTEHLFLDEAKEGRFLESVSKEQLSKIEQWRDSLGPLEHALYGLPQIKWDGKQPSGDPKVSIYGKAQMRKILEKQRERRRKERHKRAEAKRKQRERVKTPPVNTRPDSEDPERIEPFDFSKLDLSCVWRLASEEVARV
jgi:hypothetical protein